MCVSLRVSIVAGIVGQVSAAVLLAQGDVVHAAFVSTYSLIQFYEAFAYLLSKAPPVSIHALLAIQGVVYFAAASYVERGRVEYTMLAVCLALLASILVLNEPYDTHCSAGCRWNLGKSSAILLLCMYAAIIGYGITHVTYRGFVILAVATLIVSMALQWKGGLAPSWWCMTSAIAAPLYVLGR